MQELTKTIIIAIVGKSASGKDTLKQKLIEYLRGVYPVNKIITSTTRPPRKNEIDGEDYHFYWTKRQFFDNWLLEWTKFKNWYYGTTHDAIWKYYVNIGVFNLKSLRQLYASVGKECIIIPIYIEEKWTTRFVRMFHRDGGFRFEHIRRLFRDWRDFRFFYPNNDSYIYLKNIENLDKQVAICLDRICGKVNKYMV